MNNVSLTGNISTDIDYKTTANGNPVAKFNLAVTNPFNREKTSFIPVECWKAQATNLNNYCKKGSKVGVVGMIEVDQYEKDGQKRTFTKIVASTVEFLTPKSADNNANTGDTGKYPTHNENGYRGPNSQHVPPPIEVHPDDLPF